MPARSLAKRKAVILALIVILSCIGFCLNAEDNNFVVIANFSRRIEASLQCNATNYGGGSIISNVKISDIGEPSNNRISISGTFDGTSIIPYSGSFTAVLNNKNEFTEIHWSNPSTSGDVAIDCLM